MAIPQHKEELIRAIRDNYGRLRAELANIPAEVTKEKTLEGHARNTLMSVQDLLAYLIGWGQLVLKWQDRKSRALAVDFPETDYKWNELGLLAQKFYRDYAAADFTERLALLDETVDSLLRLVENESNTALYEVHWYDKWTMGRMIQLNSASPYQNARNRLRRWKKASGMT